MLGSFSLLVTGVLSLCTAALVPCQPCDHKALSLCPPVPVGCPLVKEPGCGCCLTCALQEGQACGVYTGTCTHGLRCLPSHGEEKPLHALLHGKGMCRKNSYQEPLEQEVKGHLLSLGQKRKMVALNKAKGRQSQLAHQRPGSLEHKDVPGPCRLKLDATIEKLKMNPQVVHLPNCDKRGFYKRKQCKSSLGRRRGLCWCVDHLGVRGTDYSAGQINCKELDNNHNNNHNSINNNNHNHNHNHKTKDQF